MSPGVILRDLRLDLTWDRSARRCRGVPLFPTSLSGFLRTFVSEASGDMTLRRVLIPIDYSTAPGRAVKTVRRFVHILTGNDTGIFLL